MEFALRRGEPVGRECHRVLLSEIDGARERLKEIEREPDLSVHLLRKHNKRIRSLLRLQKSAITKRSLIQVNSLVRDSARLFSDVRDAYVMTQVEIQLSIGEVKTEPDGIGEIRRFLADRHREQLANPDLHVFIEQSEAAFSKIRSVVDSWNWEGVSLETVLDGWESNYSRGRQCYETALKSRDPEDCHDWRKQAKYLSFHCHLLSDLEPDDMPEWAARSEELASWLGEHHDMALFRMLMHVRDTPAAEWMSEIARSRQSELEDMAFERGEQLFDASPRESREQLASRFAAGV